MNKQTYSITIDAPREKVWRTLWDDGTYRKWTAAFAEGSRAETDWKKGSKILFLGNGNSGMVSEVAENKPNEYMSIRHLGMVIDGVEDIDSPASKSWSGSLENYTLRSVDNKTELVVDMETKGAMEEKMLDYFKKTWPIALDKLKELSE